MNTINDARRGRSSYPPGDSGGGPLTKGKVDIMGYLPSGQDASSSDCSLFLIRPAERLHPLSVSILSPVPCATLIVTKATSHHTCSQFRSRLFSLSLFNDHGAVCAIDGEKGRVG